MPHKTYRKPDHQQAKSQLEVMAVRMERLRQKETTPNLNSGSEVLVQSLMIIASNMPHEPKKQIGRILTAWDQL